MPKKKCSVCGEDKIITDFYRKNKGKYGVGSICKICTIHIITTVNRTKSGVVRVIYNSQKQHSLYRNHPLPNYTKDQLEDWLFSNTNFNELFNGWVKSGFNKWLKPSCDRLDDYKPYELSNLRLATWRDNQEKEYLDIIKGINRKRLKPVVGTSVLNGDVVEFYSGCEAERQTGIKQSHISSCCNGKRKTAGSYKWKHKND